MQYFLDLRRIIADHHARFPNCYNIKTRSYLKPGVEPYQALFDPNGDENYVSMYDDHTYLKTENCPVCLVKKGNICSRSCLLPHYICADCLLLQKFPRCAYCREVDYPQYGIAIPGNRNYLYCIFFII